MCGEGGREEAQQLCMCRNASHVGLAVRIIVIYLTQKIGFTEYIQMNKSTGLMEEITWVTSCVGDIGSLHPTMLVFSRSWTSAILIA